MVNDIFLYIGSSITEEEGEDRTGIWRRRRLLDGSLNRVPPQFYTKMWILLEKCQGLIVQVRLILFIYL